MIRIKIGYFKIENFANISHEIISTDIIKYFDKFFDLSLLEYNKKTDHASLFKQARKEKIDFIFLNDGFNPYHLYKIRTLAGIPTGFIFFPYMFLPWMGRLKALASYLTNRDVFLCASRFLEVGFSMINSKLNKFHFPVPIDCKIKPAKINKDTDKILDIIYCGRLIRSKNLHILLKVLRRIKNNFPVMLHLITEKAEKNSYSDEIRKMIMNFELTDLVTWHGPCKNVMDKRRIMGAGDVLVHLTTDWGEGFGRVIAEAFAVGLPVITTDWFAVNELVKNKKNGFLIKLDYGNIPSENDLFNKIILLQKFPMLAKKIGENNIKKAETFDYRRLCGGLRRYLNSLIK